MVVMVPARPPSTAPPRSHPHPPTCPTTPLPTHLPHLHTHALPQHTSRLPRTCAFTHPCTPPMPARRPQHPPPPAPRPPILSPPIPAPAPMLLLPQQPRSSGRHERALLPCQRLAQQNSAGRVAGRAGVCSEVCARERLVRISFCSDWAGSRVPSWRGRPAYVPDVLMN